MAFLFNHPLISRWLVILMLIKLAARMIEKVQVAIVVSLALIWFPGSVLNKSLLLDQVLSNPNTEVLPIPLQNLFRFKHSSPNCTFRSSLAQSSFVTILVPPILLLILFCMLVWNRTRPTGDLSGLVPLFRSAINWTGAKLLDWRLNHQTAWADSWTVELLGPDDSRKTEWFNTSSFFWLSRLLLHNPTLIAYFFFWQNGLYSLRGPTLNDHPPSCKMGLLPKY